MTSFAVSRPEQMTLIPSINVAPWVRPVSIRPPAHVALLHAAIVFGFTAVRQESIRFSSANGICRCYPRGSGIAFSWNYLHANAACCNRGLFSILLLLLLPFGEICHTRGAYLYFRVKQLRKRLTHSRLWKIHETSGYNLAVKNLFFSNSRLPLTQFSRRKVS